MASSRSGHNGIGYELPIIPDATTTAPGNINNYYESLRNNVITLLEHVRIPPTGNAYNTAPSNTVPNVSSTSSPSVYTSHSTLLPASAMEAHGAASGMPLYGGSMHPVVMGPPIAQPPGQSQAHQVNQPPPSLHHYPVHHHHTTHSGYSHAEPFDSYISKLQSLCVPPDVYALPDDNGRPIYDAVKSNLHQDYTMMPTPI